MTVTVARSLAEALDALLAEPAPQVLAGGTDFMVEVNFGRRHPASVVVVNRVPELRSWRLEGDRVVLGAGVTYAELLRPPLADLVPAMAQAARTVGSPQIRNAGTLGGNLATASPAGDALPVLLALGAEVELVGPDRTRTLPVAELLLGPKRSACGPHELITAVEIPARLGRQEMIKVGTRNAMVIAVASVCVVADPASGTVRVALGSVAPTVVRAEAAEAFCAEQLEAVPAGPGSLAGSRTDGHTGSTADGSRADGSRAGGGPRPAGHAQPDGARYRLSGGEDAYEHFGRLVAGAARPIDDHRSSAGYRRHAVSVIATRALRRVLDPYGDTELPGRAA